MVFAASAYGTGGGLAKLIKEPSGEMKAEEVYFTKRMQNHHGGMIVVDGYLYGANGGNEGGWLLCLDFKTGKIMWDQRDSGQRKAPKGSILLADGLFYYRTENGTMLLIEPNPEKYIERGRFEQPDRSNQAGLGASGHRQRQTLHPRPGHAAVLRREGEGGCGEIANLGLCSRVRKNAGIRTLANAATRTPSVGNALFSDRNGESLVHQG